MKYITTYSIIALATAFFLFAGSAITSSSGIPSPLSGSPQSNNQTCTNCHGGGNITSQTVSISTDIPASGYVANTDYIITVKAMGNGATAVKGGFNATVENSSGFVGTLSTLSGGGATVNGNSATHSNSSNTFTGDSLVWKFKWNSGTASNATIYTAANFANGNSQTSGDAITTQTLNLTKSSIGIDEEENIASTLIYPNPAVEWVNIKLSLANSENVTVLLHDFTGKLVRTVFSGRLQNGTSTLTENISGLPTGTYFVSIEAETKTATQKLSIR